VELTYCVSIDEKAIAHAEIVIEGELLPDVRVRYSQVVPSGAATSGEPAGKSYIG